MAQVANALVDRGVAHVIWVTLREQTDDYRQINATIRDQAPPLAGAPGRRLGGGEPRKGLVQRGRAPPERRRSGRPGDADPAVRARGLRIGVRRGHAEGAAERAPADAPRHAGRRPYPHLPTRLVDRHRPDRLLLPLAPRNEGARGRDRQLPAPRTRRPRPQRRVPGLGGKRQRRDCRDVESRSDSDVRVAAYAAVEAASDDVDGTTA